MTATTSITETRIDLDVDMEAVVPCESDHTTNVLSLAHTDGYPCEREAHWKMKNGCGHVVLVCEARRRYWIEAGKVGTICIECKSVTLMRQLRWERL